MPKLAIALLVGVLGLGLNMSVMAKSVKMDMYSLSSGYKKFQKATEAQSALNALSQMNDAVKEAQQALPKSLKKVDETDQKHAEYQALLMQLQAEIQPAITLTEAGQLDQAKMRVDKIDEIKKQGHQNFK